MSELTDFLLRQIAADEEAAREALKYGPGPEDPRPWEAVGWPAGEYPDSVVLLNPARVLAECAAKRAIVEACTTPGPIERRPTEVAGRYDVVETRVPVSAGFDGGVDGEDVLRLLAQPYRGAEGWRDEWAV